MTSSLLLWVLGENHQLSLGFLAVHGVPAASSQLLCLRRLAGCGFAVFSFEGLGFRGTIFRGLSLGFQQHSLNSYSVCAGQLAATLFCYEGVLCWVLGDKLAKPLVSVRAASWVPLSSVSWASTWVLGDNMCTNRIQSYNSSGWAWVPVQRKKWLSVVSDYQSRLNRLEVRRNGRCMSHVPGWPDCAYVNRDKRVARGVQAAGQLLHGVA
ncbi:hypothetical protein DFH06DRAFT_1152131 [Mycena polygramma]|nr:hypothetical protein DFH06DRAFT_1152131 [Mycena polygramma]